MSEQKLKIGITQGDPNGIGWEVILKTVANPLLAELCTPVLYGSSEAMRHYAQMIPECGELHVETVASAAEAPAGRISLVECGSVRQVEAGKATPEAGAAAVEALRRATEELKAGAIDALVTAPFDKETVQSDAFRHTGHTEFFGAELEGTPMMILCSDLLRVGLVTKHLPVAEIARHITREKILADLAALRESLIADFGIVAPRIAVLALNPHAGDGGLLGREEEEIIRPAVTEAFDAGILAFGPFAADGLFASGAYRKYDGILAMYHDQGLAPFKALSMDSGVNFTAGLPVVRTSPDHGTGFDIAGKGEASADSMRAAIYAAIDIYRNRISDDEAHRSPLRRQYYDKSGDNVVLDLSGD